VVLFSQFFWTILRLLTIIFTSFTNFFPFSKKWVSISKKNFSTGRGLPTHTVNAASDLLNVHFDDKALPDHFPERFGMSGPDHHTLQILTHVITSYRLFQEIQFTKIIHAIKEMTAEMLMAAITTSVKKR
jgi:hypothetical protein